MIIPDDAVKVWCDNKQEARRLLRELDKAGIRWRSGRKMSDTSIIADLPDDQGLGIFLDEADMLFIEEERAAFGQPGGWFDQQTDYRLWTPFIEDDPITGESVLGEEWI